MSRRLATGSITTAALVGLALAGALGAPAARARSKPTGHRPEDDDYDESQHTGGRRDYDDVPEPTQCDEGPRDNRPEWQKIGDRKGRSRPNKSRR